MTSSEQPELTDGTVTVRAERSGAGGRPTGFAIERDGRRVGSLDLEPVAEGTGRLTWRLDREQRGRGSASRAVRLVTDWALTERGQRGGGLQRVEAHVAPDHEAALRIATRAGLRREGLNRLADPGGDDPTGFVVLARVATDPPLSDPAAFRALLNSFLPRKRAISQMLIRDGDGRVLLCRLTYKNDWDLPGGVVEVGESPQLAVAREVSEELDLTIEAGDLLLTDWLPPWGGWDDALCLVFDGGTHDKAIIAQVVREEREIREVAFCTVEEVRERAADFTARRVEAALAAASDRIPRYTESGR